MQVADELASAINIRVYFDALGRLVMRDTLPSIDVATFGNARQLAVDIDVIRYTLTFGRSIFANDAIARYDWEDTARQSERRGRSRVHRQRPGGEGRPAGRLTVERQYDIDARQAEADAYAQSMLISQHKHGSRPVSPPCKTPASSRSTLSKPPTWIARCGTG